VLSAGTLCGGHDALPSGRARAYNLVEIDTVGLIGRLHVREMQNDSLESPIWGTRMLPSAPKEPLEFHIQEPPFRAAAVTTVLVEAEEALAHSDAEKAVELTKPLISTSDIARKILIEALATLDDTEAIASLFFPPRGSAEIVYVADALWTEKDPRLKELIDSQEIQNSEDPAVVQVRNKYGGRTP